MRWVPLVLMLAVAAAAQQPAPVQAGQYVGVASCINSGCHGATQPLNASRVLQNEYYTWKDHDRHSKAQFVLSNAVSARIAKNMRLKTAADKAGLCLDCHATNVPARLVSGHIDIEDGIQCETCHGPASGWRDEHTQPGWTHEQSVQRGMIDLRNVPTRGSLCLSCHLGTGSKEVDHELIASGHPLLAFELDNYTASMPPHWTPGRETHGVRAWATGQAVAFRDSLDNLSRHARGEKWPEFSDMSCYNCHHGLKASQWRQVRGWPGRAGLPSWSPQHWAVLRLIVGRVAPSTRAQLDDQVQQLAARVSRMNDRDAIASSAESIRRAMDDLIPRIDRLSWSDADVRSLMNTIADDGDYLLRADVHSAEQAALSLQALNSSLTRRNPRLLRGATTRAIDDLFTELKEREDYDPQRFAVKLKSARP